MVRLRGEATDQRVTGILARRPEQVGHDLREAICGHSNSWDAPNMHTLAETSLKIT